MAIREMILPNPLSYIDYINELLIDSYVNDIPTKSQAEPTTKVAKILTSEDRFLIVTKEEE